MAPGDWPANQSEGSFLAAIPERAASQHHPKTLRRGRPARRAVRRLHQLRSTLRSLAWMPELLSSRPYIGLPREHFAVLDWPTLSAELDRECRQEAIPTAWCCWLRHGFRTATSLRRSLRHLVYRSEGRPR